MQLEFFPRKCSFQKSWADTNYYYAAAVAPVDRYFKTEQLRMVVCSLYLLTPKDIVNILLSCERDGLGILHSFS